MHALVLLLPLVWLLKLDTKMVAAVQRWYADLLVRTLMHALVVVFPIMWLLKMDAMIVAIVPWK